jgi:hypothetical protein
LDWFIWYAIGKLLTRRNFFIYIIFTNYSQFKSRFEKTWFYFSNFLFLFTVFWDLFPNHLSECSNWNFVEKILIRCNFFVLNFLQRTSSRYNVNFRTLRSELSFWPKWISTKCSCTTYFKVNFHEMESVLPRGTKWNSFFTKVNSHKK